MNEVLDDIANGRLFPSTTYYRQKESKKPAEPKLINKPQKSSTIWVSDKILKKMDIMQSVDLNNDKQMFAIIEALDKAHTDMNNITPEYFNATVDRLESYPIIKDPEFTENAKFQVMDCLSENTRSPLKCSKEIELFLRTVKNSTCSYKCNILSDQI